MDDSAKHHVRAGATTSHRATSVDVSVTHRVTSDGLLLVVQGTVTGAGALDDLGPASGQSDARTASLWRCPTVS